MYKKFNDLIITFFIYTKIIKITLSDISTGNTTHLLHYIVQSLKEYYYIMSNH